MRSAEPLIPLALLALLPLAGCTTTQQKSARAKVVANRLLAARKPLLVTRANPAVRVESVRLLRARGRSAVVVRVRNLSARVAEDLPISVGVRRPRRWLNRRGGGDYLARHVAAIPARGTVTWVFTTTQRARGRAFARVGVGAQDPAARLPVVRASVVRVSASAVTVRVTNASAIPQYGLGLYALAPRAAGRAVIAHLGTGATETVSIPVAGRASSFQIETAPTTLR